MGGRADRIERKRTPNMAAGRGGDRPRAIVLHTTMGSFDGTVEWFGNAESGVSAHFLVGLDGRIAQFVDEVDTARHAGRVLSPSARLAIGAESLNPCTIGVEFEDGGDPTGVSRPDAQYEAGALLLAGIARRWRIPLDREHVIGHREVFAPKACPGNLDVERLIREAGDAGIGLPAAEPLLACLLPARDCERELPGYMESIASLGGRVVALDDGSTDRTAELLAQSPLVEVLLRNPGRPGFAGWDDGENRRRLLRASAELEPDWILFLDADERIDPDDALALRQFLASDAVAGLAYGLALYRTWGEEDGRGPAPVASRPIYVYRLFASAEGQTLPKAPLHFNPIPTQIPRSAWVRTTIRLRHLDSPERLARRREKYREADPERRHEVLSRRMLDPPEGPLEAWRERPQRLPVLDAGGALRPRPQAPGNGPLLVCLLPARNCERDLPGYLDSVSGIADAVIALDDGSTDGTASVLEASPLVTRLLRNPPRGDYAGWDDAANRQRLLDAAAQLDPRWVLFLDADERLDADDREALRDFLQHEANPEEAYGFRVHRMVADERHYDLADLWVYRLFAFEPGQRLPQHRLHLVPVPVSIPRERWRRTTIRIQHLAGLTEERRLERLSKYAQADPDLVWQSDYVNALLATGQPREWRPRPADLPVLADPRGTGTTLDIEALDPDAPILSAIVISRNDEDRIERCVRSVVEQECPVSFEVIVVVSGSDRTAEIVRERFPDVTLVELQGRALPGRARNAGLAVARGEYVSFPGSHVELAPGSLAARVGAHERGWAMVTGSIVNGTLTRAGWASYFLDHATSLPGRASGELRGAPSHCSYVRQFLLEVGGFPEEMRAGEDTVANHALWRRGHRAYRESSIQLTHRSRCTTPLKLVRHHIVRGRALGRILRGEGRGKRRPARLPLRFLIRYGRRRLAVTDAALARWGGGLEPEYRKARVLVIAGTVAAGAGALLELARPQLSRRSAAARRASSGSTPSLRAKRTRSSSSSPIRSAALSRSLGSEGGGEPPSGSERRKTLRA